MNLKWIPLLGLQKTVYDIPISSRFDGYLDIMLGAKDDDDNNANTRRRKDIQDPLYPPLANMNPMAKTDKLVPLLDIIYDTLQAEDIGKQVVERLASRYHDEDWPIPASSVLNEKDNNAWKVGLVLVDDAGGGWTSYADVEYKHMFQTQYMQQHGWIEVMLWSSNTNPTSDSIRIAIETCIHRTAYQLQKKNNNISSSAKPTATMALEDMLDQEAWAWKQVDVATNNNSHSNRVSNRRQDKEAIDKSIRVLQEHASATDYPTIIAGLFGDDVAESLGHPALFIGQDWCGLKLCRHGLWTPSRK